MRRTRRCGSRRAGAPRGRGHAWSRACSASFPDAKTQVPANQHIGDAVGLADSDEPTLERVVERCGSVRKSTLRGRDGGRSRRKRSWRDGILPDERVAPSAYAVTGTLFAKGAPSVASRSCDSRQFKEPSTGASSRDHTNSGAKVNDFLSGPKPRKTNRNPDQGSRIEGAGRQAEMSWLVTHQLCKSVSSSADCRFI
jgi:hypothetical protein